MTCYYYHANERDITAAGKDSAGERQTGGRHRQRRQPRAGRADRDAPRGSTGPGSSLVSAIAPSSCARCLLPWLGPSLPGAVATRREVLGVVHEPTDPRL